MTKIMHLFLLMAVLSVGCGFDRTSSVSPDESSSAVADLPTIGTPIKITLYRYGDFPTHMAQALCDKLNETFPEVVLSDSVLTLPENGYNAQRDRYSGARILGDLKRHRCQDVVIGLTNRVIYHPNDISPTFGVMGLSPVGSHTCVVSSKIPKSGQTQSLDNFVKLSLHELGHAFGLKHCPNQKCYMVDAEHKMKFPQTDGFCPDCRTELLKSFDQ